MTPKESRNRLQTINEQLDRVRQQLIHCEPPDAQFVPFLESVIEALKLTGNQGGSALEDKSIQQTLKSIRVRVIRVKALLHSAASLYGNAGRWPRTEVSYGSDGRFVPAECGGQISIQA